MKPADLQKSAVKKIAPDGSEYLSLSMDTAQKIAQKEKCALRAVEIAALEAGMVPEHYLRNLGLVGIKGQLALLNAHVGIAGAGGLGGTVFEILARYGVGRITIADFDAFEESNLNRQLLSTYARIDTVKVDAAAQRGVEINPAVFVHAVNEQLTSENAPAIFKGIDLIVDALGNVRDRFIVQDAARALNVPVVHAAVAGSHGQIATMFPGDMGLEAIYGPRNAAPASGRELGEGAPPSSVMTVASLQAHEVVKLITGIAQVARHSLILIDLHEMTLKTYSLPGISNNTIS